MKFFINFLGCKVNSYETEAVAFDLKSKGYEEVKISDNPDVIILNTCAVTETSSSKSRKMIRKYIKEFPSAIVVVMGCYSQYDYDYISKELGVHIVIGTSYRHKIYELIEEYKINNKPIVKHDDFKKIKRYENIKLDKYFEKTRAYVKIQDGCDNFCTYCLIPYVRGRSRSRKKEEILSEIKTLIQNGYKEIILTGIDQGSYGKDLKNGETFSTLLRDILKENPDLYRIRISSIEESQIDDLFLELLDEYPNIANHLHIPLQSGSPTILKKMNRKYNLAEFKNKIIKIRSIRPDISITTDVIVGFPGESDDEFNETYDFIKEIRFSKVHVFPYSDRQGTIASKMDYKINLFEKKARVLRLIDLSNKLEKEYEKQFYNKKIEFLFESYSKKQGGYIGHSSNYLECVVKSQESLKDKIELIKFNKDKSTKFDNVKKKLLKE